VFVGIDRSLDLVGYPDDVDYDRDPNPKAMRDGLRQYLQPITLAELVPGCLLHMAVASEATHLAIYTERDTIIHALAHYGVKEHRLDDKWRRRIRGMYKVPGVIYG
jgi:cell wall-associated NlpC family hydrolase